MSNDIAIQTFSLTKIFPDWWGRAKVIAVDDLNLKVRKNEVYGLLGPNGSGKTTTIKILLSLLYPTKGKTMVLGGQTTDTAITSKIGYLPEESFLYKYLSAKETLDFYGRLFNLPSEVRKSRTEALLDMVGLSAVARRPVGTFSKGMARRIGLAQALINDPELLILDEPTSGLDPLGTKQIKDLIIKLAQRGKTILLCSHLLADVEDVCDRIGILYGGKMQREGKVSELLVQSNKKQITVEGVNEETLGKITQLLEKDNVNTEIISPMEKLESFFIDIVKSAQKSHLQTSGAISKTAIDDFLSSSDKNVIEKLVSGQQVKTETEITEKITSASEHENKSFLENLTKTEAVEPVERQKNQADISKIQAEKVDDKLLEELTRKKLESEQNRGTEENE